MKKISIVIVLAVVLAGSWSVYGRKKPQVVPLPVATQTNPATTQVPRVEILAEKLEIPWDLAFLPDGEILITERPGNITLLQKDGTTTPVAFSGAKHKGEGGLLGITLHPRFAENSFVYLYLTTTGTNETINRVERYTLTENALVDKKIIIEGIPGAIYHDGGRIEFGPDGLLYITTGDATRSKIAQDKTSLGGKILRIHDDGSIPSDNPFGTAVYSYGHRNPQGLAWDSEGNLWETEHGRSGVTTGYDEINRITKGANYGWPTIEGDGTQAGMTAPAQHSGATTTWAPASLAYLNGALYFGGLRGEALYKAQITGDTISQITEYFKGELGRIRTVRVGTDGLLYLTTSNRDDRGTPKENDDLLLRIDPTQL